MIVAERITRLKIAYGSKKIGMKDGSIYAKSVSQKFSLFFRMPTAHEDCKELGYSLHFGGNDERA